MRRICLFVVSLAILAGCGQVQSRLDPGQRFIPRLPASAGNEDYLVDAALAAYRGSSRFKDQALQSYVANTYSDADGTGLIRISPGGSAIPEDVACDHCQGSDPDCNECWSCVYDTQAELMWEVKLASGTFIRSSWSEGTYTNDTFSSASDAVSMGTGVCDLDPAGCENPENEDICHPERPVLDQHGHTPEQQVHLYELFVHSDLCRTNAYIDYVNELRLCGHGDWRLPTTDEIRTMVDLGSSPAVYFEPGYFPESAHMYRVWTADPARSVNDAVVTQFRFEDLQVQDTSRGVPFSVRLVRDPGSRR